MVCRTGFEPVWALARCVVTVRRFPPFTYLHMVPTPRLELGRILHNALNVACLPASTTSARDLHLPESQPEIVSCLGRRSAARKGGGGATRTRNFRGMSPAD